MLIETMNNVISEENDPKSFEEAVNCSDALQWKNAMDEEIRSFSSNGTWVLTDLPADKTAVGSKWVYKRKINENGNKARLVAQGFSHNFGSDYDEVFAPVVKPSTLRAVLTLAGHLQMIVMHYDVQSAYLNGDLTHEVYMKQPKGYASSNEQQVYKLMKNVYGLKQGANEWNKKLNSILTDAGYKRSITYPCLYSKGEKNSHIDILVYLDDLIVAASTSLVFEEFEDVINDKVVMKNLGVYYERNEDGFYQVNQWKYLENNLSEYRLSDCKESNIPIDTGYLKHDNQNNNEVEMANKEIYRSAIGSLQYLASNTRPDICIAVSILSRQINKPMQSDWTEVKRVFRYLKKTS